MEVAARVQILDEVICVSHIYQPLRLGRIWHKVNFFKQSLTGLNSELSFS